MLYLMPFFDPEPPSPSKRGKGKGRQSRCPYTSMIVSALQMGLTKQDLHEIKVSNLMWLLTEWADMNSSQEESNVREATQEDIKSILH